MLVNAFLIEILHAVISIAGTVLASMNVRESVVDVWVFVTSTRPRMREDAVIAMERLFTALLVLAAQITFVTVAIIGVFSAPPPPEIVTDAPTPFRAPFLLLQNSTVIVSALLAFKSALRLWFRRKLE